jgi:signal transduction histidine kinase
LKYGCTLILVLLVVAGRHSAEPWLRREQSRPFILLPAVIVVAWLGGLGPALLATVVIALAMDYFWTEPAFEFSFPTSEVVLFVGVGIATAGLIESLQRARLRNEGARKSREQVLAVVAHDLRNPLHSVKMTLAMLRVTPPTPEALRRALHGADLAIARMDNLIRDLVDATRLEHGDLGMTMNDEPIGGIVREAAGSVALLAKEKGITLDEDVANGDAIVRCDRHRILQVLGNLLGNALRFTPRGGHVTVRAQDEELGVRVEVEDSGPGIRNDDLPHIFDRYWNSDRRGTGLGLFISQSIVTAHGSTIAVRTGPGAGTTFSFSLGRVIRGERSPGLQRIDESEGAGFHRAVRDG